MQSVRELDIGVKILATLNSNGSAFDVSTATSVLFRFKKPDGTEISRTGSLNTTGTDGKVQYTSVANDFDQIGVWRYQVYIVMSGATLTSTDAKFKVQDAIGIGS